MPKWIFEGEGDAVIWMEIDGLTDSESLESPESPETLETPETPFQYRFSRGMGVYLVVN